MAYVQLPDDTYDKDSRKGLIMPNLILSKSTKQHLTRHEVFDKIWTILVMLGLAFMIVYGIVIQNFYSKIP